LSLKSKSSDGLLRGTGIVGGFTVLSRILGMVRDLLIARLFGAGFVADAFFVAYRIPNLLRSFLAEGALTAGFVPVFSAELTKGQEAARRALRSVSGLLLNVTLLISVLGVVFAEEIVRLFAPGFVDNPAQLRLCTLLTQIMLPYIIFISFVSMLNGALNSLKIYGAAAFAQVVMNIFLIIGAIIAGFFELESAAIVLAITVIVGGMFQVLVQVPASNRAGLSLAPSLNMVTPVTKQIIFLMIPAILGASVYQLSMFLNTLLASLLITGSISWLFYADRIAQLPVGIFSIALASVLLPTLSRASATRDEAGFFSNLNSALTYTSFFIIPVSFLLFYFSNPIVALIFERGEFDQISTAMTATAIQALCIGIWSISCHSMLVRAFLARKDTVTPTLIGLATLVVTLALSLMLMGEASIESPGYIASSLLSLQAILRENLFSANYGHVGLALSASLSSMFSFLLIAFVLRYKQASFKWSPFITASVKAILASAAAIFCLEFTITYISNEILKMVSGLFLGGVFYIIFSYFLKNAQLQETFQRIYRILNKDR